MVLAGFLALKRTARRTLFGAILGAAAGACGGSTGGEGSSGAGGQTIGDYCDQLLPIFCQHAINTCKATGPVEACAENARAVCCQGACSRSAKVPEGKSLLQCEQDYIQQSCNAVSAGLSPASCRDLVELDAAPIEFWTE